LDVGEFDDEDGDGGGCLDEGDRGGLLLFKLAFEVE
jgi:hypothetical protein